MGKFGKEWMLLAILYFPLTLFAQTPKITPSLSYRQPLAILPANLSGSFGELRANHFHSGLDYRTNQKTGYPVYAVEDGYVSRLRVQNSGFGLSVYIDHPNGQTSVYAHLDRFHPKLAEPAKAFQYQLKSYEIDQFPGPDFIKVRKGDIIGYSGNTGSSGGPHLHFEIRDTKTEATLNPQVLGFHVQDNIKPTITALYVYRLNEKPFTELTPKQYYQVSGANGVYKINQVQTLQLFGEVGFGIITNDRHNGLSGNNGVYKIRLEVDGEAVYESTLNQFSFANSRAINAHLDYPAYINFKRSIQKSFVSAGNPLGIYNILKNRGRINFKDGQLHQVKYIVHDAQGNKSELSFQVQSNEKAKLNHPAEPNGEIFAYNQAGAFSRPEITVNFPVGSLYEDLNFQYKEGLAPAAHAYSKLHQLHHPLVPLHLPLPISIKADAKLAGYEDKALIVNQARVSQGGQFENGFVKAQIRSFGNYYISIDTVPPKITPINIAAGKNMAGIAKINFKISDNLSGIKSFNGFIDGQWVLMEFDAKTANLWHTFDHRTGPGKHLLELVVVDMKNNESKYRVEFSK
ncbi:MAG: M23 family metallopeptidase [Pedobacter sp.]|nr:MAG: M23 family metallopeptidase [Pedobacter sp.]